MSLFVNMTKSLGEYIARALALTEHVARGKNSNGNSGFARWRASYERFCKHKERPKGKENGSTHNLRPTKPGQGILHSLKRHQMAMRVRFDKKGLNVASMLSGMRMARLLSITAHQILPSISALHHQSIRTKCGRENCHDPCWYPVCPPGNTRFIEDKSKLFNIYEAYWDEKNEACCDDICRWAHPRFDDIYLHESDKSKRIYTRTWWECLPRIVPKRVCNYGEGKPPEFCKRPRKERPETACPFPKTCVGGGGKCPRFTDECCCPVRDKLTCKPLVRSLTNCKKFCTPYPAFSECRKSRIRPARPIECRCLDRPTMCEFWHYWRQRYANRTGPCI